MPRAAVQSPWAAFIADASADKAKEKAQRTARSVPDLFDEAKKTLKGTYESSEIDKTIHFE